MKILGVIAMLAAASISGESLAAGALAIDSNQGSRFGYSFGFDIQQLADRRAIQECGGGRCHVVLQFSHACAAYAADQTAGSTAYGWAIQAPGRVGSSGESTAKKRALSECRKRGGRNASCIVRVWGCDP